MTSPGGLAIGVLGPLVVSRDGHPVLLTAGRLRTLLVTLALSAGEPVTISRLAAALWDVDRPVDAKRSIQVYVTRLRTELGAEWIQSSPDRYALRLPPESVDVMRFRILLDAAGREADRAAQRALLDQALALWRGNPFDDVASAWLHESEAPRLVERYLSAVERRLDVTDDNAGGGGHDVIPTLRDLAGRYPMRESLWARLLIALDRCGRQAEALQAYETIRRRIADQLGTEPGEQLQRAYTVLLTRTEPTQPIRSAVPRQLPANVNGFAGRTATLDALHTLVTDHTAEAMAVAAICGTAGVGKTTLAVHWAHQVADRFPDGQLFVNLHGFDPGGPAMSPADAIRGFLGALHVPPKRIPTTLDGQAALYRTLLAGRRVLVVLDNARDADQVGPLLPGTPDCMVVVTSRNDLSSLVARHTAHSIALDLLNDTEAHQLLVDRLGHDRIAAEPAAAREIINRCARLPLALAIVAARAATHPQFPLDTLAIELQTADGLDALASDSPGTDVRAVFSWSYHALTADSARLFRLLGLHPGPDITAPAVASLAGLPPHLALPLLTELTHASLIIERAPGRYTLHDLLRLYATELSLCRDTDADRRAAQHRILDHYLHTAHAAAVLLYPHRDLITPAPVQPGVTPESITDYDDSTTWYTTEYAVLLAVTEQADTTGFESYTWQLAWTLLFFLDRRGHWHDQITLQRAALDAATRLTDRLGQAHSHRGLGRAYGRLGNYDDAHTHHRQALDLYRQIGDRTGQAHTHRNLGWVFGRQQRHAKALHHAQRALDLFQRADHLVGQANALNAIGWCHALLGNHRQALSYCQEALALLQGLGDRYGQAVTWDSLGYAHDHLRHHQQATTCCQHAVDLYREIGDRHGEADALTHLGQTHHTAGQHGAARDAWQQALDILTELHHPDAHDVRNRLHEANPDDGQTLGT